MAFSTFANRLPDPIYKITEAGENTSGGLAGPGFASVTFSSTQPTSNSRTNSGKTLSRAIVGQSWKLEIGYNPMTRDDFEPVYNFLLEKRGRLKSFFVALPQHAPRTTTSGTISISGAHTAGVDNLLLSGYNSVSGGLRPGDVFNITDSQNSNHTKLYQIVRVNDSTNKLSSDSALNTTDERRIYINPPLASSVTAGSTLSYATPLVRVHQSKDVQSYQLATNNLFSFSLSLQETQV